MAFTKIAPAGLSTTGSYTVQNINTTGVITATSFVGSNINATGVITATSFVGDISQATGAAAGLGTALSQDQSNPLNKIYYTDTVLSIGSTQTVNPPDSSSIAYTQYAEIAVEDGYDLIIEDGDDLVPDILGLSTTTAGVLPGAGGRVRADQFTNKAGTGAPSFPNGVNVTGVVTATTFSGNLSGNVTGSAINVTGVITATSFSGDGSSLTGIDVDATQIVTGNTSVQTIDNGSDGHVKVTTEGGERLRIDSSGRISVGTTTPGPTAGEQLTIANSANSGITIRSGTTAAGSILFEDDTADRGEIQYSHNGDFMRVKTAGTERLRVLSGGGLTFNGDTATANALDDYEEGTFTPNVSGVTAYGSRVGRYTKVGRLVYVTIFCDGMNVGFNLDCQVTNLPFTVRETYSAITITHNTYGLNGGGNGYYILNQSGFYILAENSFSAQPSSTGTNRGLIASGCYLTDT